MSREQLELMEARHRQQTISLLRQAAPPSHIVRSLPACGLAVQDEVVDILKTDSILLAAPLRGEYRQLLFKRLIAAVEGEKLEISESLLDAFTAGLLLPTPQTDDRWCYRTVEYGTSGDAAAATTDNDDGSAVASSHPNVQQHALRLEQEVRRPLDEDCVDPGEGPPLSCHSGLSGAGGLITLRVSDDIFQGSTGCSCWDAGYLLAEWVLSHPALFAGKHCLEFGCGAGLVGVCLQRAGARRVTLTDGDAATLANCRRNLRMNGIQADAWDADAATAAAAATAETVATAAPGAPQPVLCALLPFESTPAALCPDVVLAADVLYDPGLVEPVLALLCNLLHPSAARGDPAAAAAAHAKDCADNEAGEPTASASTPAAPVSPPPPPPCAYLATTLRQETTWALFCTRAAQSGLLLHDLTAQAHGVGDADGGAGGGGVRFRNRELLMGSPAGIMLHRLTSSRGGRHGLSAVPHACQA